MEPAHPTGAHGGSAVVGNATPTAPAIREHDRLMPIANVIRIMRGMLPANAKISDDAKEMMQEIVSEFISFVTTEANDRCLREQRKTVTADDLLHALSRLGFDDYVPPVGVYLLRYRQSERESRRHGAGSGTGAQVVVPHEMQMPAAMYGSAPPPHGFGMPPHVLQQHGQFGQYEMYGGASGAGGGAADESGGVGLYGAGGGLGDVIGGAAVYRAGGGVTGGSGGSSGASSSRGLPPAMPPNFDCQDN